MNSKAFFLLSVTILLLACSSQKSKTEATQVISIEPVFSKTQNNKIFSSVRYVKLETRTDNLLGPDLYFEVKNNRLYILDRNDQKSVLIFTPDGKYIGKIGKYGKGPDEYTNPIDFVVRNDTVDFLVPAGMESIIYSYLDSGNFIKKQKVPYYAYSFQLVDNKYYALSTNYNKMTLDHQIYLLDENGKEVNKFLPNNTEINMSIGENCFSTYNGKVYYFEPFNNKIYNLEKDTILPVYELDFGKYNVPESFFHMDIEKGFEMLNKQGFSLIQNVFFGTGKVLFVVTEQQEALAPKIAFVLLNTKTGELTSVSFTAGDFIFQYPIGFNDKNEMMFLVFPLGNVKEQVSNLGLEINIENFNETDNPIILFYKL